MKMQFRMWILTMLLALFIGGCGSGGNQEGEVTAGIGKNGGSVTSSDNKVTITVPADAVLQTMNITVAVASNTPAGNVGAAYDLGPDGYSFNKPLTFSITYDDSALPIGINESNLRLGTVVNNAWVEVAGATVDVNTNTLSGSISHFSIYGIIIVNSNSSEKALTTFSLGGVAGTINETAKTIAVTMPFGTNVTALTATFTTTGASVKVGSAIQISGTTGNNFTNPVVYRVTAADSSTADYSVTVTVALSSAKALTAYSLGGVAGVINESAKTIAVTMPFGTNVTGLVATFTTTGASVNVGRSVQTSGQTANDFTNPVVYRVTAADGSTADYTVTVSVALSSAKALTAYSLGGVAGVINESAKTIAVTMPRGTNFAALVATFTTTGASVSVGNAVQTNGQTVNDFTNPIVFRVIAADGSTANYTITVTVTPANAVKLPKTGQTTSYAAGDDGDFEKGVAWPNPRFTVGTGDQADCVTDNLTGLMWVKSPDRIYRQWRGALDYSNDFTLCGFSDWRLPNKKELRSLASYGQSHSANWLNTQGFSNVEGAVYWSSSTNVHYKFHAWSIHMIDGRTTSGDKSSSSNYVLPVRSITTYSAPADLPETGQTTCYDTSGAVMFSCANTGQDGELQKGVLWSNPRFTANADTTVTDNLTSLIWAANGGTPTVESCVGASMLWQSAFNYVACLNTNNYLGYSDWRLPNVNELESLVNAEESNSATWLNSQGFSNVQASYYWSSNTAANITYGAFIVDMGWGAVSHRAKSYDSYVWPVRGGQ